MPAVLRKLSLPEEASLRVAGLESLLRLGAGRVADVPVSSGAAAPDILERLSPETAGEASRVPSGRVVAGRL